MTARPLLAVALLALSCGGEAPLASGRSEPAVPPFAVRGRWDDASAIPYRIEPAGGPVEADRFRAAIESALAAWSTSPAVGFLADERTPSVVFRWGRAATDEDPSAPFGRDTGVARTGPVGPGCEVLFRADLAWSQEDLERAAVHEVGHVLGLDHVELEQSALHPQRERGLPLPGAPDRAGLASLYGGAPVGAHERASHEGDGDPGAGGRSGDVHHAGGVLRAVAPPGLADWTAFDTDGDGRDEILVWATGEVGHGALTIYRFDAARRLERTTGPHLGVAGHGAEVRALEAATGERYLEVTWPDGSSVRRPFGADGTLGS